VVLVHNRASISLRNFICSVIRLHIYACLHNKQLGYFETSLKSF